LLYDPTRVYGNINANPGIRGWTSEVFWTPVQYLRIGLQYTIYDKYNGASHNYDGAGRMPATTIRYSYTVGLVLTRSHGAPAHLTRNASPMHGEIVEASMKIMTLRLLAIAIGLAVGCANLPRSRDLANPDVSGQTLAEQVCSNVTA
jgi:hypothetical protein